MARNFPLEPVLASEAPGRAEGEKASRGVPNIVCALNTPNETLQETNDKLFSIQ